MQKAVGNALKKIEPLKTHEYDGVLGMLPDWVPEPDKRRFYAARSALLEEYSTKEIYRLMVFQKRRMPGDFLSGPNMTAGVEGKIDTLNEIMRLVSLGENEALEIILGSTRNQDRSSGRKFRIQTKAGHKARNKINHARWAEYKNTINELYAKHPSHSYNRLCELTAEKHNVSLKTIQRRTTNPKKES